MKSSKGYRAKPRGRRGRGKTGSRLFQVLIVLALAGWAVFHGVERYPEKLGPAVAVTSVRTLEGSAGHVRDGDTIEVQGVPIRFGSLDCPEMNSSAGRRAAERMRALVAGETLTCHLNGRTSYDRKIGSCRLADGRDLGGVMISEGLCRRFM